MAGAFSPVGGNYALTPATSQVALATNYITDFDFMSQYLPDVYEKEFERYGNRSVASFLRMTSSEFEFASDMIKWSEQGRLHIKYTKVGTAAAAAADTATFQVNDTDKAGDLIVNIGLRKNQTIVIVQNDGSGVNKGIITDVTLGSGATEATFDVSFYEADGLVTAGTGVGNDDVTVFIYGSEFQKGTYGMEGKLESDTEIFDVSPIIMKDMYEVNGSDMAQIGWIEVTSEDGASGYLWYLKSQHDTRMRFDDYLETSLIEAVPAATGSGAIADGYKGTDGLFYSVEQRGNVWAGGNPNALSDFDNIISLLDKQGAIQENVIFLNRTFGFDIDDMLAAQNSYGAGGTSYGLFNNDKTMALNLGFEGFNRGYDFYKTAWKYLNDPTMRGDLAAGINGLLAPAGSTTVYDMILGKNIKRPYLHVRYRKSATENRKYKTWITGSAGGATTSSLDAMQVNFLSERALCVIGANNFVIFED